ncbi:hypothetical protein BC332_23173 [Capsicum chinense]|nr:hypothetical protein BC332_23173 [Capsicum chinense]
MDRSCIGMPRNTLEYLLGLNQFLDFEFTNGAIGDKIKCPCPICGFKKWQTKEVVFHHLMNKDFPKHYVTWVVHGEIEVLPNSRNIEVTQDAQPFENPIELLINEAFGGLRHETVDAGPLQVAGEEETLHDLFGSNNKDYFELLKDGSEDLYEGSKYSKLEFLLKLYHIKCLSGLSDKGMTMLLDLLRNAFKFAKIPISFYEAKKTINKLCLDYIKIDACPNDCMLYWEDDVNAESCMYCHTSRWKSEKDSYFDHAPSTKHMRWHAEDDNKDGILRHPRDGEAWKRLDTNYPEFASDPRNVRLGLASDGFNPFGAMRNNIDVYLQPLIKELNELWSEGVDTFDSSKNGMFKMRATLLWTVSDFPRLDILSGWNTHTGLACPSCNFDTEPCRLLHSRKGCFIGHRRFLARNHKFRLMRHRFDGNVDERAPPKKLSGSEILQQVKDIKVTFGRQSELQKRKRKKNVGEDATQQWKKKNIFFDLPYWEFILYYESMCFPVLSSALYSCIPALLCFIFIMGAVSMLCQLLLCCTMCLCDILSLEPGVFRKQPFYFIRDPMHIEKNVFDNFIYTLLNDKEKSKDHAKARRDLQDMGIRRDLWVDENDECKLAAFAIPKNKKVAFLKTLKNISVPDDYSSNISRRIDLDQKRIFGLKSHDCHILMQQLLPIAIRNVLPRQIMNPDIADTISDEMKFLAQGPARDARRFSAYNINGFKFRKSQANMVYYVDDENDKEWSVAVHLKPRDLFDMGEVDEEEIYENVPYQQQEFGLFFDVDYENVQIAIDEHMSE